MKRTELQTRVLRVMAKEALGWHKRGWGRRYPITLERTEKALCRAYLAIRQGKERNASRYLNVAEAALNDLKELTC